MKLDFLHFDLNKAFENSKYEKETPPDYLLPLRILKLFFLDIVIYTHSYYEPKKHHYNPNRTAVKAYGAILAS